MKSEKYKINTINFFRRHFRNTWVHRLPITSKIYKKLFLSIYNGVDKEIIFRDMKFSIPTKDVTVVPSMISGEYERFELDVFNMLSIDKKVILDIGANLGVYSIESAKASPNAKIIAFEPVLENITMLKKNIKLNDFKNIQVEAIAVGDSKKKVKIYLAKNSVGTHSMGKLSDNFIYINQNTIDNYVKQNNIKVDLIKMDIEGYEPAAILGARKVIRSHRPILFIEFSANHLKRCGFNPYKHAQNLLDLYDFLYIIDERRKLVTRIKEPEELSKLLNVNLILSPKQLKF